MFLLFISFRKKKRIALKVIPAMLFLCVSIVKCAKDFSILIELERLLRLHNYSYYIALGVKGPLH